MSGPGAAGRLREMVRKARSLRGPVILLFAYWAFFFLHRFYGDHPVDFARARKAFIPEFPPQDFAMANLREVAGRAAAGHGAVMAWGVAVFGVGIPLLGFLGLGRGAGRIDRCLFAFGSGLALGILGWLGLGLAGLWFPAVAWAAVAGGLAAAWAGRRVLACPGEPAPAEERGGGWALRLLLAALGVEALFASLLVGAACVCPERFYDAMVYHLACPSLFGMQHRVTGLPNLMHSSFPLGMQMQYGWQMMLGGEPAARAWRPWLFVAVLALVWRMGVREGQGRAGFAAAALFAGTPLLFLNSSQTSVDVEACFMVLLACLAVRDRRACALRPLRVKRSSG